LAGKTEKIKIKKYFINVDFALIAYVSVSSQTFDKWCKFEAFLILSFISFCIFPFLFMQLPRYVKVSTYRFQDTKKSVSISLLSNTVSQDSLLNFVRKSAS
jgi:hypothetical protein